MWGDVCVKHMPGHMNGGQRARLCGSFSPLELGSASSCGKHLYPRSHLAFPWELKFNSAPFKYKTALAVATPRRWTRCRFLPFLVSSLGSRQGSSLPLSIFIPTQLPTPLPPCYTSSKEPQEGHGHEPLNSHAPTYSTDVDYASSPCVKIVLAPGCRSTERKPLLLGSCCFVFKIQIWSQDRSRGVRRKSTPIYMHIYMHNPHYICMYVLCMYETNGVPTSQHGSAT